MYEWKWNRNCTSETNLLHLQVTNKDQVAEEDKESQMSDQEDETEVGKS